MCKVTITEHTNFDKHYFPLSKLAHGVPAPLSPPIFLSGSNATPQIPSNEDMPDLYKSDDSDNKYADVPPGTLPAPPHVSFCPTQILPLC